MARIKRLSYEEPSKVIKRKIKCYKRADKYRKCCWAEDLIYCDSLNYMCAYCRFDRGKYVACYKNLYTDEVM